MTDINLYTIVNMDDIRYYLFNCGVLCYSIFVNIYIYIYLREIIRYNLNM